MQNDHEQLSKILEAKYAITGWFYDILDYPWERVYRRWRSKLLEKVRGEVLEAGVGTGRNLLHYHADVHLTGIDLSKTMLRFARKRAKKARCKVELLHADATQMHSISSSHYDWVVATFLCCVMPDALQPKALAEFARVLKPGGKFLLLEMVYSKEKKRRRKQKWLAPFVEKVYGARFDRHTIDYIKESNQLSITSQQFLKDDTYLLIQGKKVVD